MTRIGIAPDARRDQRPDEQDVDEPQTEDGQAHPRRQPPVPPVPLACHAPPSVVRPSIDDSSPPAAYPPRARDDLPDPPQPLGRCPSWCRSPRAGRRRRSRTDGSCVRMGLLGRADVPVELIAAVGTMDWPWWVGVGVRIARGLVAFVGGPGRWRCWSSRSRWRCARRCRGRPSRIAIGAEDVEGLIAEIAECARRRPGGGLQARIRRGWIATISFPSGSKNWIILAPPMSSIGPRCTLCSARWAVDGVDVGGAQDDRRAALVGARGELAGEGQDHVARLQLRPVAALATEQLEAEHALVEVDRPVHAAHLVEDGVDALEERALCRSTGPPPAPLRGGRLAAAEGRARSARRTDRATR